MIRKLTLFSILFILSACTLSRNNIDVGLITDSPCKIPCWQNLIPGVSTEGDVNEFLAKLSKSDWPEREEYIYKTGCRWIHITDQAGLEIHAVIDLYIDNGKLAFVSSSNNYLPNLDRITEHHGAPEYYQAILAVGPDSENYIVEVYYPKFGMALKLLPDQKDVGYIRSNTPIVNVEYYPSGDLLSYFISKHSCQLGTEDSTAYALEIIEENIQPWSGFGEVNFVETR